MWCSRENSFNDHQSEIKSIWLVDLKNMQTSFCCPKWLADVTAFLFGIITFFFNCNVWEYFNYCAVCASFLSVAALYFFSAFFLNLILALTFFLGANATVLCKSAADLSLLENVSGRCKLERWFPFTSKRTVYLDIFSSNFNNSWDIFT